MQSALATSGIVAASQPKDTASRASDNPKKHTKQALQHKQDIQLDSKPSVKSGAGHGFQQAADEAVASTVIEASAVGQSTSAKAKAAAKRVLPSGDDLGDEFPVEIEDAEDVGGRKKKKKAVGSAAAAAPGALAPVKAKKSKHKLVKF